MKAVVFSLGCKVNQCEGQSMIAELRAHGFDATDVPGAADVYVINTCSVTGEADRKSRQAVTRVLKYNPSAFVYVCGCSSQNDARVFAQKANVRFVTGTAQKQRLVSCILRDITAMSQAGQTTVAPLPTQFEEMPVPSHTKTRSYIKIQDGCNNFCSYCIIPYLRGRSRSRRLESILEEAQAAAQTTKEIVLAGINASAYGPDIGESLCSLVRALGKVPVRKRFGSLECTVIDENILQAMAENGFCDHFHLSLQSGSESVLRRMNRKYTPAYFLQRVQTIRKFFPHAGITTDVITGCAGETAAEFEETLAFCKEVRFSDMHVFPYSERKGTLMSRMPQIPMSVRQARAVRLIALADSLRASFMAEELGRQAEVYAETQEAGESVGYTSNYIRVYSTVPVGESRTVLLKNLYKEGVKGVEV